MKGPSNLEDGLVEVVLERNAYLLIPIRAEDLGEHAVKGPAWKVTLSLILG